MAIECGDGGKREGEEMEIMHCGGYGTVTGLENEKLMCLRGAFSTQI